MSHMLVTKGNLSVVLHGKRDIRLEDRPIPTPGEGEVLIRIHSVGICGSDIHFYNRGFIGDFLMHSPFILGHEPSGTVVGTGPNVHNLKTGDRVAIDPAIPCTMCKFCKVGKENLCPDVKFASAPPYDGTMCRYFVHKADNCYKIPDHVSLEEAALLEPLSVAIQTCRRCRVGLGDNVLICGSGPLGMVNLLVARACGAAQICITDIQDHRLEFAKSMGADLIYKVDTNKEVREMSKEIAALFDGEQLDKVIESVGTESTLQLATYAVKPGGTIGIVGLAESEPRFPLIYAASMEIDVLGVMRFANNCFSVALDMVANGRIDLKPLITHRFKLEEASKAFEVARMGADGVVKVLIKCDS